MAAESSVSSLPWLWVVEALACHKQVDMPILNDLAKRASGFSDDLGKNARERVSLRCLEDLFDRSHGTSDVPSTLDSKTGFDLSESCEHVLRRIVSEVSSSDLRMTGPELFKWDVHPFIMHKKASLPKCALELLKDTLIEGTHPSASFLWEKSGLAVTDQNNGRTPVDDGDPNPLFSKFHVTGMDHQIEVGSRNLTALNSVNGDETLAGDSPHKIMLPSKRDRSASTDGNSVGQSLEEDSMRNGEDLHPDTKKYKPGSSYSNQLEDQDLVPLQRNEPLENPCGRATIHTVTEVCKSAEESRGALERIRNSKDMQEFSKRIEQSSDDSDKEVQHNQLQSFNDPYKNTSVEASGFMAHSLGPKAFNIATPNGTKHKISTDEAKDDSGDDTLSDSDGYHNEKIEVAATKHNFLSSQCTFSEDPLATDVLTEQNLCMKCNKDGQLLHCCASGCPLVVHENCLGSSANFDNEGNFYCPFCTYSRAILKYLGAKKKASYARKKLSAFFSFGCQKENLPWSFLHKKRDKKSRQNRDVHPVVDVHGNGNSREEEGSQANNSGECENQIDNHQTRKSVDNGRQNRVVHPVVDVHGNGNSREEEGSQANNSGECENQVDNHQTRKSVDNGNQIDNHQIREGIDDKQQAEAPVPCVDYNPLCREKEAASISGTPCLNVEENQGGGEIIVKECQSVRGIERQENQLLADHNCEGDNSSGRDVETIVVSWRRAEVGTKQEVLRQEVNDPPQEPPCEHNSDVEETSEDENDKFIISNMRLRSPETRYTSNPAIPMLRRKNVPWTAEEEEILKEGVQRFSSALDKTIPWTKILEFGNPVFQRSRTAIDLKDKWRNICKRSQ